MYQEISGGHDTLEMGGRKMRGFYFVEEDGCDDEALQNWVDLSVGFAAKLPPK